MLNTLVDGLKCFHINIRGETRLPAYCYQELPNIKYGNWIGRIAGTNGPFKNFNHAKKIVINPYTKL